MKLKKGILIALGSTIIVLLIVILASGIYSSIKNAKLSVPFTLINDTNEAVTVLACPGGGPKPPIEPGQSDTYYAYPGDPNAQCGFREVRTDNYIGCLHTPVTEGKNVTFSISNADPTIELKNCGLNKIR